MIGLSLLINETYNESRSNAAHGEMLAVKTGIFGDLYNQPGFLFLFKPSLSLIKMSVRDNPSATHKPGIITTIKKRRGNTRHR